MRLVPKIRVEITDFVRCCDILFNGTSFNALSKDEQEIMTAYLARIEQKLRLPERGEAEHDA